MFEKVNPSHPDKVADRIAGAVVDLCYSKNVQPKVACEVLLGHGEANIQVETSEQIIFEDIAAIVERIAGPFITTRALIVPQDSHLADNQRNTLRCGDNGIFRGMPVTHEQRLLTRIAADIYKRWPTDGKYILQAKGKLSAPTFDLTICQSHMSRDEEPELCSMLRERFENFLPKINPLGEWTGGPNVDSGATNRKLGSDMGDAVTGGGLCGKDLSKADVSVNIWCHIQAQRLCKPVEAICSIGDDTVCGIPFSDIVAEAREYIDEIGGFEKFAEWGLIRP